jgi:hypothetical protein
MKITGTLLTLIHWERALLQGKTSCWKIFIAFCGARSAPRAGARGDEQPKFTPLQMCETIKADTTNQKADTFDGYMRE